MVQPKTNQDTTKDELKCNSSSSSSSSSSLDQSNATVPAATKTPKNFLRDYRILAKGYQTLWADIEREHTAVKYPDRTTSAGFNKHQNCTEVLSQIVIIDGISEARFMEVWRWLFDSEDNQAVFWRGQTQSLEQLRKKKTGDNLNRFQKIAADYDKAAKPSKQEYIDPYAHIPLWKEGE
jgi:hypothetical protein